MKIIFGPYNIEKLLAPNNIYYQYIYIYIKMYIVETRKGGGGLRLIIDCIICRMYVVVDIDIDW